MIFTDKGVKQRYSIKRGWAWWTGHRWSIDEAAYLREVDYVRRENVQPQCPTK